MIAGNAEEIALVIRGQDAGASAVARNVGTALREAGVAAAGANDRVAISATEAAAALKGLGISAKVDAAGGISVASREVEAATNILRGIGSTAVVTSAELKATGVAAAEAGEMTVAAAEQSATAMGAAAVASERGAAAAGKIPSQARSAGNALAALSFAAMSGTGSMQSAVIASGLLTSSLATLSSNAALAGSANGIGAVVTVLGLLAVAYRNATTQSKDADAAFTKALGGVNATDAAGNFDKHAYDGVRAYQEQKLAQFKAGVAALNDASAAIGTNANPGLAVALWVRAAAAMKDGAHSQANIAATNDAILAGMRNQVRQAEQLVFHRRLEAEALERSAHDVVTQKQGALEIANLRAKGADAATIDGKQQELALAAELKRVDDMFERRDEYGKVIALTEREVELQKELRGLAIATANATATTSGLEQARAIFAYRRQAGMESEDAIVKYRAEVEDIDAQANRERATLGADAEVDIEARKQQRLRALRKSTKDAALADAGTLTSALIDSGNRQLKAIGHAGDAIRRIVIGAEAADAAVKSAKETGLALGAAAIGNFPGAALHGASALQLAAAAALGFKESLGGGGGGGGASGGAGSTGADSFTPRNTGAGGAGAVTLIVQTVDLDSRAVVNNLRYQFGRADTLNVPITGGGAVRVLQGAPA